MPEELAPAVRRSVLIQIHHQDYADAIAELNAILRDAENRTYGCVDNLLTNLTFQLWPVVWGTHYQKVGRDRLCSA